MNSKHPTHDTPLRTRLQHFLSALMLVIFVTLTTAGAFSGGWWAPAGIASGLIVFFGAAYLDDRWPRPSWGLLALALAVLASTGLLNLASSDPDLSWHKWTRLCLFFPPLLMLTAPESVRRADHPYLFFALIVSAALALIALGIELWLKVPLLHWVKGPMAGPSKYNRGLSLMVLMSMPILAAISVWPTPSGMSRARALAFKAAAAFVFVLALLFPSSLTRSSAANVALILSLLTVVVAYLWPRLMGWALAGTTFLLVSWPYVAQKSFLYAHGTHLRMPRSWRARMEIWDYMSYRIAERPWLGWGLATSRTLDFRDPHGDIYRMTKAAAPHPHNVVTQLWAELGVVGVIFGLLFALLTLRQAGRLAPPLVPYAYGAWVAALCLSLVGYDFWTDSILAGFAMTGLAFSILDRRLQSADGQPARSATRF